MKISKLGSAGDLVITLTYGNIRIKHVGACGHPAVCRVVKGGQLSLCRLDEGKWEKLNQLPQVIHFLHKNVDMKRDYNI